MLAASVHLTAVAAVAIDRAEIVGYVDVGVGYCTSGAGGSGGRVQSYLCDGSSTHDPDPCAFTLVSCAALCTSDHSCTGFMLQNMTMYGEPATCNLVTSSKPSGGSGHWTLQNSGGGLIIAGHDGETRDHCYGKAGSPSPPSPHPAPPPSPYPLPHPNNLSSWCHRYRGSIHAGSTIRPAYTTNLDGCEAACAARKDCYGYVFTPSSSVHHATQKQLASCRTYSDSDIGDGHTNIRPPPGTPRVHNDNSSDVTSATSCCQLCAETVECRSWTWCNDSRFSGQVTAPCFLHPARPDGSPPMPKKVPPSQAGWVAGVLKGVVPPAGPNDGGPGQCELRSVPDAGQSGVSQSYDDRDKTSARCSGPDTTRFDNPLYLVNSTGDDTGVPVGGIGVGYFDFAPDGQIKRVAINNWSPGDNGVLKDTRSGSFLALWEEAGTTGGHAYALQRPSVGGAVAAAGIGTLVENSRGGLSTNFTGLFPSGTLRIDNDRVRVKVWSPLIPQQIENSSLPLAYVDVTLKNADRKPRALSVALSFQDVISRGLFDATAAQISKYYYPMKRRPESCSRSVGDFRNAVNSKDKSELRGRTCSSDMARVATYATPLSVGQLVGLEQRAEKPLQPHKLTNQMYTNRVALMALREHPADHVTLLKAFDPGATTGSGVDAWQAFAQNGSFPPGGESQLYSNGSEMASAVAVRVTLPPSSKRLIRLMIAWHGQEVHPNATGDWYTVCGTTDHNHYYHNRFNGSSGLERMLAYANDVAVRRSFDAETREWQKPVLESTMPPWLQFKIINSAYTMLTNTLLNKAGFFSVMEGGMGGIGGTMDQRIAAHNFYFKFFTTQDSHELAQFAAAQQDSGAIDHFDSSMYASIGGVTKDSVVCAGEEYEDNTEGWLYQMAKTYMITGNLSRVTQHKERIKKAIQYANSQTTKTKYRVPGPGSNTYDDFWMPPIEPYMASMYNMAMAASTVLARALGNESLAADCDQRAAKSGVDFVAALYNGKFFAYGCQADGSSRRDDMMFNGMLAGQMLSRHAGWGDLANVSFDATVSSVHAQLSTFVANSYNYFPAKVWNLTSQSAAVDPEPGQKRVASTWPFYLEGYTAALAIQAGWLDDGLEVIKHIGLVNLRLGLQWAQDLWQPGWVSYVCAPVSWFLPDVLASAGLNMASHTLHLSPAVRPTDMVVNLPLFFPQMWASVTVLRNNSNSNHTGVNSQGSIKLTILKTFGEPVELRTVKALPIGMASSSTKTIALPTAFVCTQNAQLDLSAHWDKLIAPLLRPRVLGMRRTDADNVDN